MEGAYYDTRKLLQNLSEGILKMFHIRGSIKAVILYSDLFNVPLLTNATNNQEHLIQLPEAKKHLPNCYEWPSRTTTFGFLPSAFHTSELTEFLMDSEDLDAVMRKTKTSGFPRK